VRRLVHVLIAAFDLVVEQPLDVVFTCRLVYEENTLRELEEIEEFLDLRLNTLNHTYLYMG
jgi:hypothetical protein